MSICIERIVGAWNSLPVEVVDAETIGTFKGHLYSYLNGMGREAYGPRKGRSKQIRWAAWSLQSWRAEGPVPVM